MPHKTNYSFLFLLFIASFLFFLFSNTSNFNEVNRQSAQVYSSISMTPFSPITIEAETGSLVAPMQIKDGYVYTPTRDNGSVSFNVNIPSDDNYVFQILVNAPTPSSNMSAKADSGAVAKNTFVNSVGSMFKTTSGFEWRSITWPHGNIQIALTAGSHTFTIIGGYTDVQIDKVRIIKLTDVLYPNIVSTINISGNVAVMNNGLKLENQDSNGCYFNSGSAAYSCFIRADINKFEAVVKLPRVVTPGDYWVFVKTDTASQISVSNYDQKTVRLNPVNNDADGMWTSLGNLKFTQNADKVVLNMFKTGALSTRELNTVYGIYITNDPNEKITSDDVIYKTGSSSGTGSSAIHKGNLISNGSFEVGLSNNNWILDDRYDLTGTQTTFLVFNNAWESSVAYDGRYSLKLEPNRPSGIYQFLFSKAFHLDSGKKYSLSVHTKADTGKTARVFFRLVNIYDSTNKIEKIFDINGSSWQTLSISGTVSPTPVADYRIETLVVNNGVATNVFFDDFQLEEGDVTDYAPATDFDVGLKMNNPANLFYESESVSGTFYFKNNTTNSSVQSLNYEVYDNMNNLVDKNNVQVSLVGSENKSLPFRPSVGKRGIFRVLFWLDGSKVSDGEITFSIVPRPVTGDSLKSFIGMHAPSSDFQLPILKKLGINWLRTLSTADFLRWSLAEPTEGNFVWFDADISRLSRNGFNIMANVLNSYPAWAKDASGYPKLDKIPDYLTQMVNHYKPWIKYWEIDNEPNGRIPASYYAQELKVATEAIKAADPEAKVVGLGGASYTTIQFIKDVMAYLATNYPDWVAKDHIDYLAVHSYVNGVGAPSAKTLLIDPYGIPVWNTETGSWDSGFYLGDSTGFSSKGRQTYPFKESDRYYRGALSRPEAVVQNFLSTIGGGHTKYFYYDSRVTDQPFKTQPTITETDDSINSKGVAYALSAYFIDYSDIIGSIDLNTNVYAFLFDRQGVPTLAIWSKDLRNRYLKTSLSSSSFNIFDMMGNSVNFSGGDIPIGRTPIYVVGRGISTADFKTAISSGTITSRADVLPPKVLVVSAPRGKADLNNLRIRWFGVDETSIPEEGSLDPEQTDPLPNANPNAILYSYRLQGLSGEWSAWAPDTFYDYSNLSDGSYTFEVMAKDEAGNISSIASRSFTIGESSSAGTPITSTPEEPVQGGQPGGSTPPPASDPKDMTAPTLSAITNSIVGFDNATISWWTNEPASSQLQYGFTSSYGSVTPLNPDLTTNHSVSINGLNPNTTYHYKIISTDPSGNSAVSGDYTFTTTSKATEVVKTDLPAQAPSLPPSYDTTFKGTGSLIMNLLGDNPTYIKKGSSFVDPGVVITGSKDDLFRILAKVDDKDVGAIYEIDLTSLSMGEHKITYTFKDSEGYVVTGERKVFINRTGAYEKPTQVPVSSGKNVIHGSCLTTNNQCASGTLLDTIDSPTEYLWTCEGSGGGLSSYCKALKPAYEMPPSVFKTKTTTNEPLFARTLTVGQEGEDVRQLQKFLNNNGYIIKSEGVGSPGQENTYFGFGTQMALKRYQCLVLNICFGSSYGTLDQATINSIKNKTKTTTPATTTKYTFTKTLKIGQKGEDVKQLQKFLNNNGFPIASTGPGSKGNESTTFGPATAKALIKFQEAYAKDILTPSGLKKGTGTFGPSTMKKVNGLVK